MQFFPLSFRCPTCDSPSVFYTCTPDCCFNHLCEHCRTTFEPATTLRAGQVALGDRAGLSDDGPADTTASHAGCASCDSVAVCSAGGTASEAACGSCYALLTLTIENIRRDGDA